MRYLLALFAVAAIALFGSQSMAQEMYVGVAGGYTFEVFDQDGVWEGLGADPDEIKNSFAGHVFLGYGVSEVLTIEGDFGYYLKWTPDESALDSNELSLMAFTVSAKYNIEMDTDWSPYVIGGIGWGKFEATDTDAFMIPDQDGAMDTEQSGLLARVGGGIEYVLSETMTLIADVGYVFTFGDIEDWNFIDIRIGVAMGF